MSKTVNPKPGPNASESRKAVLEVLDEVDEPPCLSAGDVAKQVDFSRRTVNSRLNDLEEEGTIKAGEVAGSPVYWIDNVEADGYGIRRSLTLGGLSPAGAWLGQIFGGAAIIVAIASLFRPIPWTVPFFFIALSILGLHVAVKYQDVADPSFEMKDWATALQSTKEDVDEAEGVRE